MDAEMRKAVEERAHALWEEAGRPDGSALMYWLRAEQEFGIVPRAEPGDPLVTLQELAVEARALEESEAAPADEPLQDWSTRLSRLPSGSLAERTRIRSASTSRASRKGSRRYRAPRQSRVATRCLAGTKGEPQPRAVSSHWPSKPAVCAHRASGVACFHLCGCRERAMTSDEFAEALSRLIVEAEDSGLVREQILAEIEAVTEAMWNAEE